MVTKTWQTLVLFIVNLAVISSSYPTLNLFVFIDLSVQNQTEHVQKPPLGRFLRDLLLLHHFFQLFRKQVQSHSQSLIIVISVHCLIY